MNHTASFRPMSKSELAQVLRLPRTQYLMENYVTEQLLEACEMTWEQYKRKHILPERIVRPLLTKEGITAEMAEQRLYSKAS